MSGLLSFLDELIRYNSQTHFAARRTLCDITLAGMTIPAGAPVALLLASANRDRAQFTDSDKFDITRKNIHMQLGFGAGIHRCTGAFLAKTQVTLALEALLERFQHIHCPNIDELPWFYSFVAHGVKQLPIRLH